MTSYALYVTELVNQFTADHIENQPLFELLVETLHQMCREGDRDLTLRYFEMHLLNLVGYRPQLSQCVTCRSALEPQTNYFSPRAGGVLCPGCRETQTLTCALSVNALKVLRWLQSNSYETLSRLKIEAALSRELEMVMRDYLKYLLDREVKSTEWLDIVRERD